MKEEILEHWLRRLVALSRGPISRDTTQTTHSRKNIFRLNKSVRWRWRKNAQHNLVRWPAVIDSVMFVMGEKCGIEKSREERNKLMENSENSFILLASFFHVTNAFDNLLHFSMYTLASPRSCFFIPFALRFSRLGIEIIFLYYSTLSEALSISLSRISFLYISTLPKQLFKSK